MGIPGNRFGSDQVLPGKGLPKRQKKLLYERPGLAKKWRGYGAEIWRLPCGVFADFPKTSPKSKGYRKI
jgi:hypothetical protein